MFLTLSYHTKCSTHNKKYKVLYNSFIYQLLEAYEVFKYTYIYFLYTLVWDWRLVCLDEP